MVQSVTLVSTASVKYCFACDLLLIFILWRKDYIRMKTAFLDIKHDKLLVFVFESFGILDRLVIGFTRGLLKTSERVAVGISGGLTLLLVLLQVASFLPNQPFTSSVQVLFHQLFMDLSLSDC